MENADVTKMPLERLVRLALERQLVEDWRYFDGGIQLRIGILEVRLSEPAARVYLGGLIRVHDLVHSSNCRASN